MTYGDEIELCVVGRRRFVGTTLALGILVLGEM